MPSIKKRKRQTIIAILTVADQKRPFRGDLKNFIDIMKAGHELGATVYVTTTDDLKLTHNKIVGHYYDFEKGSWQTKLFPLPHVIYNRIPYRKFEMLPEVQQTIQACLKHNRIKLYNPSFFNKWTLFEWLSHANSTRAYIPKTERLQSMNNLESLFNVCSTLYLKPIRGKAGRGIMRVSKKTIASETQYRLVYHNNGKRQVAQFNHIYDLWQKVREETGTREYIVQQGIALTRFKKRPFDLRILVQKNGKGLWSITGMGGRVAGRLSITTHVPRGGSIDEPEVLLSSKFGMMKTERIMKQAQNTALVIARQIERASGTIMGEMSMDLGVDTNGNLWFFEANSKPMKFDEPHIRKKSLNKIIRFCTHLSKNTPALRPRTQLGKGR